MICSATILGYQLKDFYRPSVVKFNEKGKVVSIKEKLQKPKSHFAVAELYFYNNDVKNIAKSIQKSNRGELEITCVNRVYFHRNNLYVKQLSRSSTWLDTGIQNSMLDAAQFVETIESRQGYKNCSSRRNCTQSRLAIKSRTNGDS
jgi:glucose-1-phosphate thymidylyltransferase